MNQTFSIIRFGRYLKFCFLRSRLAIVLPIFAIVAATLSVFHNAKYNLFVLVWGMAIVMVFPSSIFTIKKEGNDVITTDGTREMLLHPVSTIEKYIAQIIIALMMPAMAFGFHAAASALGLNGVSSVVADGFFPGTMAAALLFVGLSKLLANIQFKTSRGDVSNVGFFALFFAAAVFDPINFWQNLSLTVSAAIFAAGLAVLCLDFCIFKHRNIKF